MGPGSKQASLAAGLCPQSWTNRLLPASSSEDKWICRCGACNGHRGQSLGSDTACRFFCVRRGACGLAFPVKRHCKASRPRAGDARNQSIHDLSAKSVGAENALATTQGVDAAPVPPSLREALKEGLPASLPGGPFSALVAGYGPRDRFLSVGAESAVVTNQGVEATRATDAPTAWTRPPSTRGRQAARRGQSASRHKRFSSFARLADTPGELERLACNLRVPGQGPPMSVGITFSSKSQML